MDKDRLISAIQELNPTARRTWLGSFPDDELKEYLSHLEFARGPRSASQFWAPAGYRSGPAPTHRFDPVTGARQDPRQP